MSSGATEKKPERSYFEALNPWSRSSTPVPKENSQSQPTTPLSQPQPGSGDHSTTHLYGQSFRRYPPDCPPLKVLWYHAVDVPKRKPQLLKVRKKPTQDDAKPPVLPKKYIPFTNNDSQAIETLYQKLLEEREDEREKGGGSIGRVAGTKRGYNLVASPPGASTVSGSPPRRSDACVPVNEDYLFEVDIEGRELAPVYWLGPSYDVRRGTWFYQEGNSLRPCEENLAAQLEEGYLKVKPWNYVDSRSRSNSRARSASGKKIITPKTSIESLKGSGDPVGQPQTYRLFGTYMSSVVTYQDAVTAWLSSDGMLSWVTSTMYERFAGGGYMSGAKLIRGYTEPGKAKESLTPTSASPGLQQDEKQQKLLKRRSAPPSSKAPEAAETKEQETTANRLARQLSSLLDRSDPRQSEAEEEVVRIKEENEIENDYNAPVGETQGREIEHLILITHGIGQLLSLRMESVNFIHDINSFRKTLKTVYSNSADLRALNSELADGPGNCRVQVLPVCWRHLLDFPKQRRTGEHDLAEGLGEEDNYPSLEDITIEGVAFARSLVSDLALDVLLYQSAYREQISEIVLKESNRIYRLFMDRNPNFRGKVHIMGHSLGSAIMFDIICRQKEKPKSRRFRFFDSPETGSTELRFDFDVDDFYCLGSPVGLFEMLKGRTVAARHMPNALPSESPLNSELLEDPFMTVPTGDLDQRLSPTTGLPFSVSSPKVAQLFNIFHPSDPISYRLEPLISPAMSSLKPQTLPYTKKGIFGSVAPQGLTGIGVKVGQSVTGLWSSISAGIASNILNRSLGLSNEDVANITAAASANQQAGASEAVSGIPTLGEKTNARKKELADSAFSLNRRTSSSGNELTLIDDELETLYSRFQKKQASTTDNNASSEEDERRARKLRREELKVRALNRNGRVDYSIQESALDFNPINTIASHMSYWADEDVSHFIISQLLSNKSKK